MADEQSIRELVEKMSAERERLIAEIEGVSEADASRPPVDGEGEAQWSVKEQCAHLAEMESAYRAWVRRALAEDNPDVSKVEGEPVGIALEGANQCSIPELVTQLRAERARTLSVIERLTPEQYDRTATHRAFSTLTVLQWLRSYYRHDRMHQAQIAGRESEYKPNFAGGREPDQRRVRLQ